MSTELVTVTEPRDGLHAQMDYARAVQSASMLPEAYRGKPADIMLAVGLGQSMGLSPAESLYRINVIKGKPTASAELIAANVRKAGHRLRVHIEPGKATATIVRSDDPDYEFTIVRDATWAKDMGLADQPNYRKQGDTMLSWRAITACARLACPEALYGVVYTADEVDWSETRTGGLAAALADDGPRYEQTPAGGHPPDATPSGVGSEGEAPTDPPAGPDALSDRTRGAIFALFGEVEIPERERQLAFLTDTLGRAFESRAELTEDEGQQVEARLRRIKAGDPDAEWFEPTAEGGA